MTCDRLKDLFSELHEGTLDAGLRQSAEHHLYECPACEHEFKTFARAYDSIGPWSEVTPPADLSEQISQRLDRFEWERKQASGAGSRWFRLALVGAAAAVVVGGVVFKQNSSSVEGGVGFVRESRPVYATVVEGKVHLQMRPGAVTKIWILQGGTDYSAVPPKDAKISRHKEVGNEAYDVPLNVDAQNPDIVWATVAGGTQAVAVIFPHEGVLHGNSVHGNLVETLQAVADKYGVTIEARLSDAGEVAHRDISGSNVKESLAKALNNTGLTARESGGLVHVR